MIFIVAVPNLLTLINDVLDLSKIEACKMKLEQTEFHFRVLLESVVEMCRIKAENKGLDFFYKPDAILPVAVRTDETRLRQVLINFLSNAIKFTRNGRVTLSVERTPNHKIRFQISDTGIGMTPEQLERIFQPFEQVGEKKHQVEGTGLGLAISQKIVQLMGSQIHVTSEVGVGSMFWFDFDLPIVMGWSNSKSPYYIENTISVKGILPVIMVVDDKWENRSVIANLLQPIVFQVINAHNGKDALEKIEKFLPDVIITDLVMPVMDEFEMIRKIRSSDQTKHMIVIICSAIFMDIDQIQTFKIGADDFICKPVQITEVLMKLQKYFNLEWIYSDSTAGSVTETINTKLVTPPAEELEILYDLASKGNMKGIMKRAKFLQELNPEFSDFAWQIHELA